MKQHWVVICLVLSGVSSTSWAQLAGRCGGDDNLTPQQVQGRNAWARKCNYISATKEAILNADGEYQVFANGCFQYPCSTNNCQVFVPISPSAPCVTGLILLGTCMASLPLTPWRSMLAEWEPAPATPQWAAWWWAESGRASPRDEGHRS